VADDSVAASDLLDDGLALGVRAGLVVGQATWQCQCACACACAVQSNTLQSVCAWEVICESEDGMEMEEGLSQRKKQEMKETNEQDRC
jgi:hypothetical protein